jgi:hypothetical protein
MSDGVKTSSVGLTLDRSGWNAAQSWEEGAKALFGKTDVLSRDIRAEARNWFPDGVKWDREFTHREGELLEVSLMRSAGANAQAAARDFVYAVSDLAQMGFGAIETTGGALYGMFGTAGDAWWTAFYAASTIPERIRLLDSAYQEAIAKDKVPAHRALYDETRRMLQHHIEELRNPEEWALFAQGVERFAKSPIFMAMDAASMTKNTFDMATQFTAAVAIGGGRGLVYGLGQAAGYASEGVGAGFHGVAWILNRIGDVFDSAGDELRWGADSLYRYDGRVILSTNFEEGAELRTGTRQELPNVRKNRPTTNRR